MGYKLLTAEKPSVARDIARVAGAHERKDGYYQGNGYIVTWAIGHLIELAEPEEYGFLSMAEMWSRENPGNRERARKELPLFPDRFKTVVKEGTKDQYGVIRELMRRPDVDMVIDCGDMGPEGHYLQWLIREQAGCAKPVKRFCATSMTDEAIAAALGNLRDIKDFERVVLGEWCKHRADWIFGMSMSRAASIKHRARVDVGRVLSPTLYFVVKRWMDVSSFKPADHYTLTAAFAEGFTAQLSKESIAALPPAAKDGEGRAVDKSAVNALRAAAAGKAATVAGVETSRKTMERPQLYDITELMRDANRIHGYGAEETLKAAQGLYEKHKILSYPRTDSRHITSDLAPYMEGHVKAAAGIPRFAAVAKALLSAGLNLDKRVVDDAKVTDHHALIVTDRLARFDAGGLSETERNVLDLVVARMLVALCGKHVYDETRATVSIGGIAFTAGGKTVVEKGFMAAKEALLGKDGDEAGDAPQQLPPLAGGQTLGVLSLDVAAKKTAAPKLHTEGTLLTAMENAGAAIEGGAVLKGRGIGTQATRAAIIAGLFEKKYIEERGGGKTKSLVPTKQGINVIKVLPPDCYSPKITADWEENIAAITGGAMTEDGFMQEFRAFVEEMLRQVEAMDVAADFKFDKEPLGKCPWCGGGVFERAYKKDGLQKAFYPCSGEGCGFSLPADNIVYRSCTGKDLTAENVKALLNAGSITAACKKKDGSGTYKGKFTLAKAVKDDGREFASLKMDLASSPKKKKARKS
jgi:DNA topoisomerase-3